MPPRSELSLSATASRSSRLSRVSSSPHVSNCNNAALSGMKRNMRSVNVASAASVSPMTLEPAFSTVRGTAREQNEDRLAVVKNPGAADGQIENFFAVYDGHGGDGTSIWLVDNFYNYIKDMWSATDPKSSMIRAFESADEEILKPRGGVFGIGAQRGVGGSKCGSTAATVVTFNKEGKKYAVVANIGDSMVMKKSNGEPLTYVSTEHVPDNEEERKRIEMYNPNPKMPLVRYVENTWRVGGLLALSRAFGDAYLKPSVDFEGIGYQDSDYMSGFGLIARPDVEVLELNSADEYMIIASDGLFETELRGGGGGLTPEQITELINSMKGSTPEQISAKLAAGAQAAGSTDDVTVIYVPLN